MPNKFSSSIIKELKYYVYLYLHPISKEIFYVGKGRGNRAFTHLEDQSENNKTKRIKQIRDQGLEPEIEILVHGIDENTALRVEASVIDLLGKENLTNKQLGYKSRSFGRMNIQQIISNYKKEKAHIAESSILIRINQAFRYSMSPVELYDYTRGQWKVSDKNAKHVQFAFSIYRGIVQEVYEIVDWYPANSTFSVRGDNSFIERNSDEKLEGRKEFVGNLAKDKIRNKYLYKSVEHYYKQGMSNPIMYLNID